MPSYVSGSPVSGVIRPPLIAVRNQSSSIVELLSVLSPVVIAKPSGWPVAGPCRRLLTRSISASVPTADSASCGRQSWAACTRIHSNRSGDCTSITCRSVSWTNAASAVRRPSRPLCAAARSVRTTRRHAGPSTSRLKAPLPLGAAAECSVVPWVKGATGTRGGTGGVRGGATGGRTVAGTPAVRAAARSDPGPNSQPAAPPPAASVVPEAISTARRSIRRGPAAGPDAAADTGTGAGTGTAAGSGAGADTGTGVGSGSGAGWAAGPGMGFPRGAGGTGGRSPGMGRPRGCLAAQVACDGTPDERRTPISGRGMPVSTAATGPPPTGGLPLIRRPPSPLRGARRGPLRAVSPGRSPTPSGAGRGPPRTAPPRPPRADCGASRTVPPRPPRADDGARPPAPAGPAEPC